MRNSGPLPLLRIAHVTMLVLLFQEAWATTPYASSATGIFKRTEEREAWFASAGPDTLQSLCYELDGRGYWLPSTLLTDISRPNLEGIAIFRGMGFSREDEFVQNRDPWALSVVVPTWSDRTDKLVEGPRYVFVLQDGRVTHRVTMHWPNEEWRSIDSPSFSSAPCLPSSGSISVGAPNYAFKRTAGTGHDVS